MPTHSNSYVLLCYVMLICIQSGGVVLTKLLFWKEHSSMPLLSLLAFICTSQISRSLDYRLREMAAIKLKPCGLLLHILACVA